jgi:hypothetical protein
MSASEEGAANGVWGEPDGPGPTNEPVRAVLCGLELVLLLMSAYTDWAGSL